MTEVNWSVAEINCSTAGCVWIARVVWFKHLSPLDDGWKGIALSLSALAFQHEISGLRGHCSVFLLINQPRNMDMADHQPQMFFIYLNISMSAIISFAAAHVSAFLYLTSKFSLCCDVRVWFFFFFTPRKIQPVRLLCFDCTSLVV